MKRGKPTQGIGSPNEPPLDDESGVKAGLSRRHTHRGLGDSQAPKLVTMHGVAPPSDPPPPPAQPVGAPSAGRFFDEGASSPRQLSVDVLPHDSLRAPLVPHFDGDDTPDEGEFAPLSNQLGTPVDRSQFRTAPGGGKNRVSGGRAAASAYVSPSTLAPGHGAEPKVQSVEVDSRVIREARFHQTEPSLVRRRASQVPPEPTELPMKKASWLLPVLIVLGVSAALAAVAIVALLPSSHPPGPSPVAKTASTPAGRPSPSAPPVVASAPTAAPTQTSATAPAVTPTLEAAPSATPLALPEASSVDSTNSRNLASQRPTTSHADHSSHPTGTMSSPSSSAVQRSSQSTAAPKSTAASRSTAAPKSTAAPQPATAPNRDLWIE